MNHIMNNIFSVVDPIIKPSPILPHMGGINHPPNWGVLVGLSAGHCPRRERRRDALFQRQRIGWHLLNELGK